MAGGKLSPVVNNATVNEGKSKQRECASSRFPNDFLCIEISWAAHLKYTEKMGLLIELIGNVLPKPVSIKGLFQEKTKNVFLY
jgi:hypothetical protein